MNGKNLTVGVELSYGDSEWINNNDGTRSVASSTVFEDLADIPVLQDHKIRNALALSEMFPNKAIAPNGLLSVRDEDILNHVFASRLTRSTFMHPLLTRQDGIFRDGSLEQFIDLNMARRGELANNDWAGVIAYIRRTNFSELFADLSVDEAGLSDWLGRVSSCICTKLDLNQPQTKPEALVAMKGALAYADAGQEARGELNDQVGYLGKADYVFKSRGLTFAAVEYKMARLITDNVEWFNSRAVLAQIMCWIAGDSNTRFGLVLTEIGFKLIYRIEAGWTPDGIQIFNYYMFPPRNATTGKSLFLPCRESCPEYRANIESLIRVIYELTKTAVHIDQANAEETARLSGSSLATTVEEHGGDNGPLKAATDRDNLPSIEGATSYSFQISSLSGEPLECVGMTLPLDFAKEEDSDSDVVSEDFCDVEVNVSA